MKTTTPPAHSKSSSPTPARSDVKVSALFLTHRKSAVVVAVASSLTRIAPAEDVARSVLDELAELADRTETLDNDSTEMTLVLPGLNKVHLVLARHGGLTVLVVAGDQSEVDAWHAGRRVVSKVRAVDAAWLWALPTGEGGAQWK